MERLAIVPLVSEAENVNSPGGGAGAAGMLIDSATYEDRLAVTPALRLMIRTADLDRWVTLVDLPDEAEADDKYGGLEGDRNAHLRAAFGDIYNRIKILHINLDDGICYDPALLTAIVNSPKVAAEEHISPRTDLSGGGVPHIEVTPLLSDFARADVEKMERVTSEEPPALTIAKMGKRARLGGVSVFLGGTLFGIGEYSRDEDGVARWKNLLWLTM